MTGTALFEPDMCLRGVDHPDHGHLALRTTISVEHVYEIPERGVSDIDRFRVLPITQSFDLTRIEPESETARATIDLDTGNDLLFHLAVAFGTTHGTRAEAVVRLAHDDTAIEPE